MSTQQQQHVDSDYDYAIEEQVNESASGFIDLVYKRKNPRTNLPIRIRRPNKEGQTRLLVQPAFGKDYEGNPHSWQPYRRLDKLTPDGIHVFTNWVRQVLYYPFIGGRANIISPRQFKPDRNINPLSVLFTTARKYPEFRLLAGYDPETNKKPKDQKKDAFKDVLIRPETKAFVVNAINPGVPEENAISCVYEIGKQAWAGSGKTDERDWGLMAKLNQEQLDWKPEDRDNFAKRYYWGDPTDISLGYRPISIYKKVPPSGGIPVGYAEPTPKVPRVPWHPSYTESRERIFHPTEIFTEVSDAEIIDVIFTVLSGFPKLLKAAFETTVPNIGEKMLKYCGVTSDSTVHQPGSVHGDDQIEGVQPPPPSSAQPPAAAPAPAPAPAQQFAPPPAASAVPPPPLVPQPAAPPAATAGQFVQPSSTVSQPPPSAAQPEATPAPAQAADPGVVPAVNTVDMQARAAALSAQLQSAKSGAPSQETAAPAAGGALPPSPTP